MRLSGKLILTSNQLEDISKEVIKEYYEFYSNSEKKYLCYFEFDSKDLNKYLTFLSSDFRIMSGKKIYKYIDGKLIYQTSCAKSAKQEYKSYKKCYNKIKNYNIKYRDKENATIINGINKIFGFKRMRFCDKLDYTLPFAFKINNSTNMQDKLSVFIFLHGFSRGGESNIKPLIDSFFFHSKLSQLKTMPSMIIVPSLPSKVSFFTNEKEEFDAVYCSSKAFDGLLSRLLENLQNNYNIDDKRIYLIGVSNGAMGVWSQLYYHPNRYAAAIALMGCANIHLPEFEERVALTPIWAAHAKNDKVIPPNLDGYLSGTDLIVNILKNNTNVNSVKYTRYEKYGHKIDLKFFRDDNWIEWLISHKRTI